MKEYTIGEQQIFEEFVKSLLAYDRLEKKYGKSFIKIILSKWNARKLSRELKLNKTIIEKKLKI